MNCLDQARATVFRVRGTVQGVGFRPFVYRLAQQNRIVGWARNDSDGALIWAEGPEACLRRFAQALHSEAPVGAVLDTVRARRVVARGFKTFTIEASTQAEHVRARVPRDRTTCAACRREVFDPGNRRALYAFTNCTDCGPRYSLIEHMPYDRSSTGMRRFPLCPICATEYGDPGDRRFHAEPNACPACGPRVVLLDPTEGREPAQGQAAVLAVARHLKDGRIVALKALGGYQLLARADRSEPVTRLRAAKGRPTKPLAVMVRDIDEARRLGRVEAIEGQLLESAEGPIVLLGPHPDQEPAVVPEVAPGVADVGVLLPTTPLHHLILSEVAFPIVATSGNRGDEPIATDRDDALRDLAGIADVFLDHDRPILRRVDDSVVRVISGRPVTIRLARGYAPFPLRGIEDLARDIDPPPILAVGGHQKSTVAVWTGSQAVLSPHIGDLDTVRTRAAFVGTIEGMNQLYGCAPTGIACDLHPGYFSTKWAMDQGLPVNRVQHHHAHAVSGMVEHGLLDREVLAVTWDGTGLGPDGTIWGGEVLQARIDRYERVASLRPFALPGNDAAIHEPRRVALAVLADTFGAAAVLADAGLLQRLGLRKSEAATWLQMVQRGFNTSWTTSVGRLFDAVASWLLRIGEVSYEGEAAVRLEAVACPRESGAYPFPCEATPGSGLFQGDWRPMIRALRGDADAGVPLDMMASRFHNTLARWARDVVAAQILSRKGTGFEKTGTGSEVRGGACPRFLGSDVVLGGGCFQNRLLAERVRGELESLPGARVFGPGAIPPGDGGLAVGQLAVALGTMARSRA